MSLLSVTVKKARFVGVQAQQFNTYVTLKLQNVKSTTVTVKGPNPCWEQDFLFETNDVNTGLLVEVWSKGMLWDRALGYHYIPLPGVSYANEDDCGQWISLDSELEMRGGEVVGTKCPTGHSLLIACRFEQPFDPENTEAADLQRKLEMLNNTMDQEARAEQARRQLLYNIGHSGYSEDSDYTSDLNYPVGGQGANSSASQFRAAANQLATPQRSLETSRENSYERDDHQIPATVGGRLTAGSYSNYMGRGHSQRYGESYPVDGSPHRYNQSMQQQQPNAAETSEPLSYNSRPKGYREYRRRKHTWDYEDSQDGWYSEGYDYPNTKIDDTRIYSDSEYYPSTMDSDIRGTYRRPSLERQTTLYDEQQLHYGISDTYSNETRIGKMSAIYPECQTDIIHDDYYDSITGYVYQDERYGQVDEDRQWDSGGKWYLGTNIYQENKRNRKSLPQRPASSIGIHRPNHRPTVMRQRSYESEELDYSSTSSSRKRKMLQPQQRPMSHQDGRAITGKKLPPTPTKRSNITLNRKPISLPATPGRQLPRTRTPPPPPTVIDENYYQSDYNEDYNYAYQGSQDNLQQSIPQYSDNIYSSEVTTAITTSKVFDIDNEFENGDELYSETENLKSNQYHSDYISQSQQNNYQQNYPTSTTAYDMNNQQYIDNSFMNNYQQTSIQQEQHQQQSSQSIYHDPTSVYQNNTYPIVNEIENYENTSDELMNDDNNYKNTYDENYQDSYSESFKQDSFPESYTDSYKDENYHDEQSNAVVYSDYNVLPTSNHQPTKTIYTQQKQQQQQPLQQQDVCDSYETTEILPPVSHDNYQELSRQGDLKQQNSYDNYDNEYLDNYQDQYSDQYQNGEDYQNDYQQVPELSIATSKSQIKTNGYQSNGSEYFYANKDEAIDIDSSTGGRKKLARSDISPLLQQNTDSLESRDDELKDSFETAVSSGDSSQIRRGFNEYSTAGGVSPIVATFVDSPMTTTVSSGHHYTNLNDSSKSDITTALVHTIVIVNGKRQLARTESYIVDDDIDEDHALTIQERNGMHSPQRIETVGDEEYIGGDVPQKPHRKDSQLSHQSQISQQSLQQQQQQQKGKLLRGDSYDVDEHFDEKFDGDSGSGGSRQDSYQESVTTLGRKESYSKRELTRGTSIYGHNYSTPQPISRAESYQRGYFKDQDSIDETEIVLSSAINGEYKMRDETLKRYERGEEALARGSRENSLVEPYKSTPPLSLSASPRGSITKQTSLDHSVQMDTPPRSPPEPLPDEDILDMVGAPPVPTQLKERPEMTAKQRWHWAYNKIIMQLNVSTPTK